MNVYRLTSTWCQEECLESILEGQPDSHIEYSAYLRVVKNYDTKSLEPVFGVSVKARLKPVSPAT